MRSLIKQNKRRPRSGTLSLGSVKSVGADALAILEIEVLQHADFSVSHIATSSQEMSSDIGWGKSALPAIGNAAKATARGECECRGTFEKMPHHLIRRWHESMRYGFYWYSRKWPCSGYWNDESRGEFQMHAVSRKPTNCCAANARFRFSTYVHRLNRLISGQVNDIT